MALSAAEKNRRKRERKKKEKEERRKQQELEEKEAQVGDKEDGNDEIQIEIEYVSEDLSKILNTMKTETQKENNNNNAAAAAAADPPTTVRPDGLPPIPGSNAETDKAPEPTDKVEDNSIEAVLRRFHERAAVMAPSVSDGNEDESNNNNKGDQSSVVSNDDSSDDDDDSDDDEPSMSKRKLRELIRPTVAELKRRVQRPDLVEAHDVTAADPDLLIALKGISHTTPVPFHWGRKRKYLQGKRGMDKVPFKLPDFIIKTGIADVRDTAMEDEAAQSAKQKNRGRINPKMGTMDVDYKVLYDAFFKYQTKPTGLTSWGDLYYEGKETENSTDIKPGGPFSKALTIALGMGGSGGDNNTPPPWLWNMQRYGPPPGHPKLKIPGLNAPLPNTQCQYGYHPGGWGKPPVDAYGRPLYGGNPLDPPGSGNGRGDDDGRELVTSDGKTVLKSEWGGLPTGEFDVCDDDNEDDSNSDMDDSSSDDDSGSESGEDGMEESDNETESVVPPPPDSGGIVDDLRKQSAGDETPIAPQPKRLYQVLETGAAPSTSEGGAAIFGSDVRYVVPGATSTTMAAPVPEGAESVLSKAVGPGDGDGPGAASRKKRKHNPDDETDELEKNFKF